MAMETNVPLETSTNSFAYVSRTMDWFWSLSEAQRNMRRRFAWSELKRIGKRTITAATGRMLLDVHCLDIDCMKCPASEPCFIEVAKIESGRS